MNKIQIRDEFAFVQIPEINQDYGNTNLQTYGLKFGDVWIWRNGMRYGDVENLKPVRYYQMQQTGRWLVAVGMYLIRLSKKMEKRNL